MASDFRPDYSSKDPYANAPDEYYKMVLAHMYQLQSIHFRRYRRSTFRQIMRQNIL